MLHIAGYNKKFNNITSVMYKCYVVHFSSQHFSSLSGLFLVSQFISLSIYKRIQMLTLSAVTLDPLKVRNPFWWNRSNRPKTDSGWEVLACNHHHDLQMYDVV